MKLTRPDCPEPYSTLIAQLDQHHIELHKKLLELAGLMSIWRAVSIIEGLILFWIGAMSVVGAL